MYFILSPTFAAVPSVFPITSAVFVDVTIAVSVSFVSSPLTTATFLIVPVAVSETFTWKLISVASPAFKSMFHFKATTVFPSFPVSSSASAFDEFSTYVVISGIKSFTSIPSKSFSELFLTEILYVITSPFVVVFSPVFVSHTLFISKLSFLAFISLA